MGIDSTSDVYEQEWVAALRRRDAAAFAALFERYSDPLYRLSVSLLHDELCADDVVQVTFTALIEHIDRFDGRASLRTWLYRVAYNACMQRLRVPDRETDVDDWDDGSTLPMALIDWRDLPENVVSGQEAHAQVAQAIAALTPTLRAVFTLRDIEGLSTRETAEALGLSEAAVKVNLHRARLFLRERLAGYFEECSGQPGA